MSNNNGNHASSSYRQHLMERMLREKGVGQRNSKRISKRNQDAEPMLSFAQQRLWFLDELTPGNTAYTFTNIVHFDGRFNASICVKSLREIVQRHENLRTIFKVVDGIPTQFILDEVLLQVPLVDLSDIAEVDQNRALQKLAVDESKKAFNLQEGPMIRACLVTISDTKNALILTMHHIVYDGWSLMVLFSELKSLYEAFSENLPSPLNKLEIQYADYALWQRAQIDSDKFDKQLQYWKKTLSGDLPTLELTTDRKRPSRPISKGAMEWFYLPSSLSNGLSALAKREECTLFMVLLASFNILLSRFSGETDIIIGTPIANRNRQEIENLIGFFINSLLMRTSLDGDLDFCDLLERTNKTCTGAYENQDYPFEKLVEVLKVERSVNQNPIFQTMFALQNTPPPPPTIGDIDMIIEEVNSDSSVFDITLSMYEHREGLRGYFEYSTELFDQSTIANMIECFKALLENIVDNPEEDILQLSVLNKSTYKMLVNEWNAKKMESPEEKCIFKSIENIARANPDAIAVATTSAKFTYRELDQQASTLAKILVGRGVRADDFVGICLNRSFEMFVSILGIMKAGAAYLPLDPGYPEDRLDFAIKDTNTSFIVTNKTHSNCLPECGNQIYLIDDLPEWSAELDDDLRKVNVSADNLAYIIYTSGSTGKPKGVQVTHRNLSHSTNVRRDFYDHTIKSFLLTSSFAFDSSVAGIFWTLCDGGTLVLPEDGQERDIFEVAKLIQKNSVTHMLSLPSVYALLLSSATTEQIASLKTVCVAGEECPSSLVAKHFEQMPEVGLFNEYGPTEGSVWSSVYQCSKDDISNIIPIGKPIANVQMYILDQYLSPVPIGVPGEIFISGEGITKGYLNRDTLTKERYINNPFADGSNSVMYRSGDIGKYRVDGNIEFLGRNDEQVKVNGYRIELGEVEDAILKCEFINQCAVVVHKTSLGDNRLVAFIESQTKSTEQTRLALTKALPSYMIPSSIVILSEMPLLPNGKIDRKALSDLADTGTTHKKEFVSPRSFVESVIAKTWEEFLELERVSTIDNFFELGGHSILATRVISQIYQKFGVRIAIRNLFDNPTVRGLANEVVVRSKDPQRVEATAEIILQVDELSEQEIDALLG